MISINLTIFVQMANFALTYYVLSNFLLKPILNRILDRRKDEQQLREEIVLKQTDVSNFLKEKSSQLAQFQRDSTRDYPFYSARVKAGRVVLKQEAMTPLDKKTYDSLKQKITQRLCNVDNV